MTCCLGAGVWWTAVLWTDYPDTWLNPTDAASLAVEDAGGQLLRQEVSTHGMRKTWKSLDEISEHLVHATLASEDANFYEHGGVDWMAIARATWLNMQKRRVAFGGSTITMQLVRLTANTKRTLWGKVKQSVLAKRLERKLSKKAILEQYLNRAYYGNGAWGAEQAAQRYFSKPARELSLGESAFLAVIPRGPQKYNPLKFFERVERRRKYILSLMSKRGYISQTEAELAERLPVQIVPKRAKFQAPHFVEYVKSQLPDAFVSGTVVKTTLDLELQKRVEVAAREHVGRLTHRGISQTGVVVLRNSDGAVLAMVGSVDYFDKEHNGAFNATTARIRPGSTLKPFVYGAAMEQGDTPSTIAFDVPLREDVGQFYTKDVKSHGHARYREALAGSYNLSAVHALQRVGVSAVLNKLRQAGLSTLDRPDNTYDEGLAIGHAEVRLIDLVAAFSTFARGGRPIKPRAVELAKNAQGKVWRQRKQEGEEVFSAEISYLLFDILSDPDARKPMFGDHVPMNLGFPVALKTGTTKAYTDLWAVGTTNEYTVGVWAGNFDGSPSHQVMSVEGATPLVRAVYSILAAQFGTPTSIPRPEQIVRVEICPMSGKRKGPHCDHGKLEWFEEDNVPDHVCDWHVRVCDQKATVLPEEVRGWARQFGRLPEVPVCNDTQESLVRILSPEPGARFVLEPHRSVNQQRPPLRATPLDAPKTWTINGEPAEEWTPKVGAHRIRLESLGQVLERVIYYEE